MRSWPQSAKQALRLLAAARYFLPEELECQAELECGFRAHLHHAKFQEAWELLEQIGDLHANYENEMHFWKELYYAAQELSLPEHAARCEERLRVLAEMQRMSL